MAKPETVGICLHQLVAREEAVIKRVIAFSSSQGRNYQTTDQLTAQIIIVSDDDPVDFSSLNPDGCMIVRIVGQDSAEVYDVLMPRPLLVTRVMRTLDDAYNLLNEAAEEPAEVAEPVAVQADADDREVIPEFSSSEVAETVSTDTDTDDQEVPSEVSSPEVAMAGNDDQEVIPEVLSSELAETVSADTDSRRVTAEVFPSRIAEIARTYTGGDGAVSEVYSSLTADVAGDAADELTEVVSEISSSQTTEVISEAVDEPAEVVSEVSSTVTADAVSDDSVEIADSVLSDAGVSDKPVEVAGSDLVKGLIAGREAVVAAPPLDSVADEAEQPLAELPEAAVQDDVDSADVLPVSAEPAKAPAITSDTSDGDSHDDEYQYRALVVDDSAAIRKQLELELRDAGIGADFAEDGEQAMEKVQNNRYDLIFLDIIMPGIDGYETCRQMRKLPVLKKTPIIMLSAKTSPLDEVQGVIAGASTYLTKPVKSEQLQSTLKRVSMWIDNFQVA